MASRLLVIFFLAALIGGGIWYWSVLAAEPGDSTPPAVADSSPSAPGSDQPVEPFQASTKLVTEPDAKPREAARAEPSRRLQFPDGTSLPALNGVVNPPPMEWPQGREWSPVVRKIVDNNGLEWYEHKDGSFSTTRMTYRSDLGREDAVTQVASPAKLAEPDFDK